MFRCRKALTVLVSFCQPGLNWTSGPPQREEQSLPWVWLTPEQAAFWAKKQLPQLLLIFSKSHFSCFLSTPEFPFALSDVLIIINSFYAHARVQRVSDETSRKIYTGGQCHIKPKHVHNFWRLNTAHFFFFNP